MVRYGIQPFIFLNITNHELGISIPPTFRVPFGSSNVAFDTCQGVKYISSNEDRGWYVFHMEEGIYIPSIYTYMEYITYITYIHIHIYI